MREYHIHKALDHPNVVRLHDVFEIDANTFCTVLDFCPGGDLDAHLKDCRLLSEREARAIIVQVRGKPRAHNLHGFLGVRRWVILGMVFRMLSVPRYVLPGI